MSNVDGRLRQRSSSQSIDATSAGDVARPCSLATAVF